MVGEGRKVMVNVKGGWGMGGGVGFDGGWGVGWVVGLRSVLAEGRWIIFFRGKYNFYRQ